MTTDEFVYKFNTSEPVNYDIDFVREQLDVLDSLHRNSVSSIREENMILNITCSALKYYLDTSPEGYGEDIINITDRLELLYDMTGLFESLLEVSV